MYVAWEKRNILMVFKLYSKSGTNLQVFQNAFICQNSSIHFKLSAETFIQIISRIYNTWDDWLKLSNLYIANIENFVFKIKYILIS